MGFNDPKNGKDYTLCFFVNNLVIKGAQGSQLGQHNKPRWDEEDKTIQSFNFSQIPKHDGLNVFMYDISNEKSFEAVKEQLCRTPTKDLGFAYLIGNKCDKQHENRQVEYEDAQKFAQNMGMMFSEVSATTK